VDPRNAKKEPDVMVKINLTYFLYGAIVFTDLAWASIGALLLTEFLYMPDIAMGPLYVHRILLVLLPLPWAALIGFSWFSHALQRRGQSEAAWSINFLSLTLWAVYEHLAFYLTGLGLFSCAYLANS